MSKPIAITQWDAMCDCGSYYGDTFDTEQGAVNFIRKYPTCSQCESD